MKLPSVKHGISPLERKSRKIASQSSAGVTNLGGIFRLLALTIALSLLPLLLVLVVHAQDQHGRFPGGPPGGAPGGPPGPPRDPQAQDPGVRSDAIDAGQPLPSVAANDNPGVLEFFQNGLARFQEIEVVQNGVNIGLGPRFNFNQCAGCHAQPAVGGSSPAAGAYPNLGPNPQTLVFNDPGQVAQGAALNDPVPAQIAAAQTNTLPSFILPNGPVREVRFPYFFNSNGSANLNAPDGGVHDLFTISGRPDAGSCSLSQPNFSQAMAANNIIFRIPTPVFGAGLIENISDTTLLANQSSNQNNPFGISGTFNRSGNDGTITRFGWKAQNKSLLMFAGEAYNVEMGVTNELMPSERPSPDEELGGGLPVSCLLNPTPEDSTNFTVPTNSNPAAQNAQVPSDIVLFAMFMRLLAPPTPSTSLPGGSSSIAQGSGIFNAIGCANCHTPTLTTFSSAFTGGLNNQRANLFSDLELHHMGQGLADNVSQGGAGGDQFRSAPLWGLGQRIFFLHDGRTANLVTAITQHASQGSEANAVVQNFNQLSPAEQQALLNFLRSL
jgi:CxxC motif-containing protein (DUF1111 family)